MKRTLSIYQYVAPVVLTPACIALWYREYAGDLALLATAVLVPILWAYIVPGIGTNVLKVWEFDTRLRLGRFRPHHGFVFGSATSMIAWVLHSGFARDLRSVVFYSLLLCLVLAVCNIAYDVKALQAGILRVYNQPWADGRSELAIAMDYGPWFFGGFGLIYGAGLGAMEVLGGSFVLFFVTLGLALVVPVVGYAVQSTVRHGHWGVRPVVPGPSPLTLTLSPRDEPARGEGTVLGEPTSESPLPSGERARVRGDGPKIIPERLNWLLLLLSAPATASCLWLASHGIWWLAISAAIAFAFIKNLPFALMHEAVHGVASASPPRNEVFGFLAACMFPTSFSLQRVAHLGHHQRNRTDSDLYDYYLPGQSRFVRNVWLYGGNLLGLYWFLIPLSNLIYLVATPLYRSALFVERVAPKLGFGPHVRDIARLSTWKVWLEIACAFTVQAWLWWALELNWQGWLLAHWVFAMHWSALQYVDHAWSARDVESGAWNLRVFAPIRWLTLNYHLHRAHHTHPGAPWTALPGLAGDAAHEPTFLQIYWSLWRNGVQLAPPMGAPADRSLFAPSNDRVTVA